MNFYVDDFLIHSSSYSHNPNAMKKDMESLAANLSTACKNFRNFCFFAALELIPVFTLVNGKGVVSCRLLIFLELIYNFQPKF